MTWAKFGVEFFDQCAESGLSDPAVRTHVEALHYLYRLEAMDMRIAKQRVRRFAGSDQWEIAVKDLVNAEFWLDVGDAYVVEHHADVFRQSLAAQLKHRDSERERQRRKRERDANVGTNTDANVGTNVRATQTDRHTDRALEVTEQPVCRDCWAPLMSSESQALGQCGTCRAALRRSA